MSAEPELLSAIVAQPDDLVLRGVYADWLEERGQLDRATCIRTECSLADTPAYDIRWIEYGRWRVEHGHAYATPPLPPGLDWGVPAFHAGFPSRLSASDPEVLIEHAPRLFAQMPIRALTIKGHHRPLLLGRLLAEPWLRKLRYLEISGGALGRADVDRLSACEHLVELRTLALRFGAVSAEGIAALLWSPLVQRIDSLELGHDFFVEHGAPLADAFRDAPPLPALHSLEVASNRLAAPAFAPIVEHAGLSLARLDAYDNPLGDDGWAALARSPHRYTDLAVGKTYPGVEGIAALAASPHAGTLQSLDVMHNRCGPKAAAALASVRWPALEFLSLSRGKLGDDGVMTLARAARTQFPVLRRAEVRSEDLSPRVAALALAWFHSTDAMLALLT